RFEGVLRRIEEHVAHIDDEAACAFAGLQHSVQLCTQFLTDGICVVGALPGILIGFSSLGTSVGCIGFSACTSCVSLGFFRSGTFRSCRRAFRFGLRVSCCDLRRCRLLLRSRGLRLSRFLRLYVLTIALGGLLAQCGDASVFGTLDSFARVGELHLYVAVLIVLHVVGVLEVSGDFGHDVGGVLIGTSVARDAFGVVGFIQCERIVLAIGDGVLFGVCAFGIRVQAAGQKLVVDVDFLQDALCLVIEHIL